MRLADLKESLKALPTSAGVYQMHDKSDQIIYVGKAKNLQKRVSSYFSGKSQSLKTKALVEKIHRISHIVTLSETDALLLECELIKKESPKYNILLRDDKSYPYIALSKGNAYPKIGFYRGRATTKLRLFGPYTNTTAVKETLATIQKLFRLRTCRDSNFNNRERPCLEYQIGRCSAPCVEKISKDDYQKDVELALSFLKGKSQMIIEVLTERMKEASHHKAYEKAARIRDQIQQLAEIQKSKTLSHQGGEASDVIGVAIKEKIVCIYLLVIREGQLLRTQSFYPSLPVLEEYSDESLLAEVAEAFIKQYYLAVDNELPYEIVSSIKLSPEVITALTFKAHNRCKVIANPHDKKKKWQLLATANAENALAQHLQDKYSWLVKIESLSHKLGLKQRIKRIECFDISHTGGEATKASCVVFDSQGPNKKSYRQFNIENITGGDDYAAMEQALDRRYSRLLKEKKALPEVLLIDGGLGQIGKAMDVLNRLKINEITVIGVAKGPARKSGEETLLLAREKKELSLAPDEQSFHLIQHIRDEAHRFAVTSHRKKRDSRRVRSVLEEISGVGQKKRAAILTYFGGIQKVKEASVEELLKVRGVSKALAENIYRCLKERE